MLAIYMKRRVHTPSRTIPFVQMDLREIKAWELCRPRWSSQSWPPLPAHSRHWRPPPSDGMVPTQLQLFNLLAFTPAYTDVNRRVVCS